MYDRSDQGHTLTEKRSVARFEAALAKAVQSAPCEIHFNKLIEVHIFVCPKIFVVVFLSPFV